jgi:hypothetical protein
MKCPYKYKRDCKVSLELLKIPCNKCSWYDFGIVESKGVVEPRDFIFGFVIGLVLAAVLITILR